LIGPEIVFGWLLELQAIQTLFFHSEARGEEAVEARQTRRRPLEMAWQSAQVAARSQAIVEPSDLAGVYRNASHIRIATQKGGNQMIPFLRLQRTRAVNERASRFGQLDRLVKQLRLHERQTGDVARSFGPGHIGMSPDRACGAAWRVEQDCIELRRIERKEIGNRDFGVQPQPVEIAGKTLQPLGGAINRGQTGAGDRDFGALAARSGA